MLWGKFAMTIEGDGAMKIKQLGKAMFVSVLLACLPTILAAQEKPQPDVYSAVAVGTGGGVGGKTMSFDVRITSYTTDAEVQNFAGIVKAQGPDALRRALDKEDKGRVSPVGSTGNEIAVARKRTEGANTIITVVTTRLQSFYELSNRGRVTDYPFGFIQLTVNDKGEGTGKIMAAAKIKFDKKKGQYVIESFGNQYIKVVNVRLSK
jgi:hypothetical protein